MEVFMRNLPVDLNDYNLQQLLKPTLDSLAVPAWECRKLKRKNMGTITFLHHFDGGRFLRSYGEIPVPGLTQSGKPKSRARLTILGSPVYCSISNKEPDHLLLKSMRHAADERRRVEEERRKYGGSTEDPKYTKVTYTATSLSCGYYTYDNNDLVFAPEIKWPLAQGLAKFAKHALVVTFNYTGASYKIEIPYRTIEAIIESTQPTTLTLTLWEAPRFYKNVDESLVARLETLDIFQSQKSQTPTRTRLSQLPHPSNKHLAVLGESLVYRIAVMPTDFYSKTKALRSRDLFSISHYNLRLLLPHEQRSLAEGLELFTLASTKYATIIPFDVMFQLDALVKNGYLLPWTVEGLRQRMVQYAKERRLSVDPKVRSRFPISAPAVRNLMPQIDFPSPEINASDLSVKELFNQILENQKEIELGHFKELITERGRQNLTMVFRATVTPTRLTLHGPEPEAKNRILRRFQEHTDHFIRVQFCEEDGKDIMFNQRVSNDQINERFKAVFKDGINIGGRRYGFLGFSHSSLRSHSAWFMAPFVYQGLLQSYFSVISYLGEFEQIQSPARCAARIGQAFSETPFAISLQAHGITNYEISDVKSLDGLRVFSDGVGSISQEAAEEIYRGMIQKRSLPTCFQIRWGGAKGMLAIDARLSGKSMCIRPSMVKFESKDTGNLEICDTANKPIPMFLNRQMIKILEDMGVTSNWCFGQQDHELARLKMVTAHISNTVHFLKGHKVGEGIRFPQLIRRLHDIGIDYKNDSFLCSVVQATILRELRLLKHKARIPIMQGVTLFGIMDETAFLQEGEIYVAFDDAPFIKGCSKDLGYTRVIVTRSPALHPGDIQLATNVIPPTKHALRALRNCVVFSQKGKRDLPSCLSGGDLDGDIYGIIWDRNAVSQCQRIYEPADYPRVAPLDIGRTVKMEDMTDFFIQFMATDQLGLIATRHMILADQRDEGTLHKDCLDLAEMHSTSVDYSKTGIPPDLSKLGKANTRLRPDFLAPAPLANIKDRTDIVFDAPSAPAQQEDDEDDNTGPTYSYYRSEKILGQLYRAIDEQKVWYESIKGSGNRLGNPFDELRAYIKSTCAKKLGRIDGDAKAAVRQAWEIRHAYEDAIYNVAMDYSDSAAEGLTELEVFIGDIFNKTGVQTRRQRDSSVKLKDEFHRIARWAEGMIRKRSVLPAEDAVDDDSLSVTSSGHTDVDSNEALQLSIACLEIGSGVDATRRKGRQQCGELQSFEIVAACCAIREMDAAIRKREDKLVEARHSQALGLNVAMRRLGIS